MADKKIVARPWQPQDLINDLQGIIDEECDNYLNTRRTTLCMARDYLKEYFAEQKWIPVTERLPEEECRCLVIDAAGDVEMDWYDGKGRFVLDRSGAVQHPSHWMPLPEPPKGE